MQGYAGGAHRWFLLTLNISLAPMHAPGGTHGRWVLRWANLRVAPQLKPCGHTDSSRVRAGGGVC